MRVVSARSCSLTTFHNIRSNAASVFLRHILLQSTLKPIQLARPLSCELRLLEVSCLFATSHKTSDIRSAYLTELRAALSLSQALDGFFRSRACGRISSHCHVQASAVQGLAPANQPSFLTKGPAPLPLFESRLTPERISNNTQTNFEALLQSTIRHHDPRLSFTQHPFPLQVSCSPGILAAKLVLGLPKNTTHNVTRVYSGCPVQTQARSRRLLLCCDAFASRLLRPAQAFGPKKTHLAMPSFGTPYIC